MEEEGMGGEGRGEARLERGARVFTRAWQSWREAIKKLATLGNE